MRSRPDDVSMHAILETEIYNSYLSASIGDASGHILSSIAVVQERGNPVSYEKSQRAAHDLHPHQRHGQSILAHRFVDQHERVEGEVGGRDDPGRVMSIVFYPGETQRREQLESDDRFARRRSRGEYHGRRSQ